jgi:hypothetical protein
MSSDDEALSFGIEAATGRPLNALTDGVIEQMLGGETSGVLDLALKARTEALSTGAKDFGIVSGEEVVDPNDLATTGWGILYGPNVSQKIKDALAPLIELRRREGGALFKVFDADGVRKDETVYDWLKRRKVSLNPVEPSAGVPYYLLIVASPQDVSFEFQYTLDLYWACGRLWFDTAEEFGRYAQSVVKYETDAKPPTTRQLALFAPEHDFDNATQLFTRQVAEPLCGRQTTKPALGTTLKYQLRDFLGVKATKDNLANILRGKIDGGKPALLFSGGHGMQFDNGHPQQLAAQGALVCQDWAGYGAITDEHWFAAKDVPADANVHGLIHFMFACHGGGVPQFDNFDRLNNAPREIAPRAFFSKLPQALLAHKNGGALAVLAHMERAWAYGFQGDGGFPQIQGFRGVLASLLRGDRIGQATDTFNVGWAAASTRLSEAQFDYSKDSTLPVAPIRKLWIQRDDARNFMVFGDPAVRLRQQEMPPLAP